MISLHIETTKNSFLNVGSIVFVKIDGLHQYILILMEEVGLASTRTKRLAYYRGLGIINYVSREEDLIRLGKINSDSKELFVAKKYI